MIIADMEHLEVTCPSREVEGGGFSWLFTAPTQRSAIPGRSIARFNFNSLAYGGFGAIAGGEPEILTTAVDDANGSTYSVGFKFSYHAEAIGFPIEMNGG